MIPESLLPIANHLWQSTLFAAAAGLLTLALRKNSARARYWVWVAASFKFLIPFSVLVAVGGLLEWRTAPAIASPYVPIIVERFSQPFTVATVSSPALASTATPNPLPAILFGIWACGFMGISISWWIRWQRIAAAARAGSPVQLDLSIRAVSSPSFMEPGIFGVFQPILFLPQGILEHLTPEQLKSIIAHELCHVRHRDNLIGAIQMFVETVFWFHPLVWWMGKRILQEKERACDEEVLLLGSDPRTYAQGILKVCELYLKSPLECVAGVSGANLKKRIEGIMNGQIVQKMTRAKKLVIASAGAFGILAPIVVGVINAPLILAQFPAAATPKWEVVSIRPCEAPEAPLPGVQGKGKGPGGPVQSPGPGYLNICRTAIEFIQFAYVQYANGDRTPPSRVPIEGGPNWIRSDHYRINAKAEGQPAQEMMRGPMLRALLEDRFGLTTHHETRTVAVYELTAINGRTKLQPFKEGSCITPNPAIPLPPPSSNPIICGGPKVAGGKGQTGVIEFNGVDMNRVVVFLSNILGRPVIDKTGVTGLFNVHLEFALDESTPGLQLILPASDERPGPSIFTAVQEQLGLKLNSANGPGEFLVIDHVERPSEN